jgi:hypothetical protein
VSEDTALEGWAPEPATAEDLARVVDLAFDYRGDVTLVLRDGGERVGYLFNRDGCIAEPFVEILEPAGAQPVRIRYSELRTIHFSGKDTASGKSYAAWLERKGSTRGA